MPHHIILSTSKTKGMLGECSACCQEHSITDVDSHTVHILSTYSNHALITSFQGQPHTPPPPEPALDQKTKYLVTLPVGRPKRWRWSMIAGGIKAFGDSVMCSLCMTE